MSNVRACPYCGGTNIVRTTGTYEGSLGCSDCATVGPKAAEHGVCDEPMDAWNRRPAEDALRAELDAAMKALRRLTALYESDHDLDSIARPKWLSEVLAAEGKECGA